jgi:hypothetical protein
MSSATAATSCLRGSAPVMPAPRVEAAKWAAAPPASSHPTTASRTASLPT